MDGRDAVEWLLRRLSIDKPLELAPGSMQSDCTAALSAAIQEIYRSPEGASWARADYGFRATPAHESSVLAANIVTVIGHVTCDGTHVTMAEEEGNFRNLPTIYKASPLGPPRYGFLRKHFGGAQRRDAVLVEMLLYPVPLVAHEIKFVAQLEPPDLTVCNLRSVIIPVPDRQVELILLPIALDHLRTAAALPETTDKESIKDLASAARRALGLTEADNHRRREGAKLPA
jgi:hypothetical protein